MHRPALDVRRHERIDDALAVWDALGLQTTPFVSADWARAWWPTYGRDVDCWVLSVHRDDRPLGLVALVLRRRLGVRVLEPLGVEPGDYWDVVAAPADAADVAAAAAAELRRRRRDWDIALLRYMVPGSPLPAALAGELPASKAPVTRAPAVELPADFDAYLRLLPSGRRQNLRRHLRRLDTGEVALHVRSTADDAEAALDRWVRFREAQWAAAGRDIHPDHLSPRFRAFMGGCAERMLGDGRMLVWEFEHAGEIVGTYVNFADDEAFYWYLGGFDPAVGHLGLGKIAIAHGIRCSIEAGRRRFDFSRGVEPYKYFYGAVDRDLPSTIARGFPGLSPRLAAGLLRAKLEMRARRDRGA